VKFVRSARPVNLAGTANQKVVVSAVFVAAMFRYALSTGCCCLPG